MKEYRIFSETPTVAYPSKFPVEGRQQPHGAHHIADVSGGAEGAHGAHPAEVLGPLAAQHPEHGGALNQYKFIINSQKI